MPAFIASTRRLPLALAFAALSFAACAEDSSVAEDDVATESDLDTRPLDSQIEELLAKHPEAKQLSDHEVSFEGGKVVLDLAGTDPEAAQDKASVHGCPSGWFCFYQHQNFGGRRLQFSDCTSGGKTQYLTDYGFGNQTTSWVVNRAVNFINVNDHDSTPQWPRGRNLWNARSHSQSSNVGADANDKADWFICYK